MRSTIYAALMACLHGQQEVSWLENANPSRKMDVFDPFKFAEGSSLEMARLAAAKIPTPYYVITDEVRAYEPVEDDYYFTIPDGRYANKIFTGLELRDKERESVDKFRAWVAENQLYMPIGFADDHYTDLRYLSTSDDFQKVYDDLIDYDRWLRETLIPLLTDWERFSPIFETGAIYGYKRDTHMRPITIINCRVAMDSLENHNDIEAFSMFMNGYTQFNALVPGKVEQYQLIIDLRDLALWELPIASIVQISKNGLYFKQRSFQTIIIGVGWLLRAGVNILKGTLDPFQKEKVMFYGYDDFKDDFAERIGLENLEEKYFGQLPDLTEDFFPPRFNSVNLTP